MSQWNRLHFVAPPSFRCGDFCFPHYAISCCFSADIWQANRTVNYECATLRFNTILVSDLWLIKWQHLSPLTCWYLTLQTCLRISYIRYPWKHLWALNMAIRINLAAKKHNYFILSVDIYPVSKSTTCFRRYLKPIYENPISYYSIQVNF